MSFWLQAMSWTSCYRSVFILRESETCRGFGGFPGGTSDKESTCQCRRHKRLGFDPWVRKIPWRRAWQPTPAFLPGESHGQRSLAGYILEGCKKLDMTKVTCMHACACVHTHTHTHTHTHMRVHRGLQGVQHLPAGAGSHLSHREVEVQGWNPAV